MDGVNFPTLSSDWFATAIIAVVSAIISGIVIQLAENKIPGNRAINFLAGSAVLALVVVFAWYNLVGTVVFAMGTMTESSQGCVRALPAYKSAVGLNSMFVAARTRLVFCSIQLGKANEATSVLEPLQNSLSDSWNYWNELARLYYVLEDYSKMLAAVERAADLNPQESAWITSLGEQLHRRFIYPEAEAVLRIARIHNGADRIAPFWLGWTLYEQHKYDDALNHFDLCTKMNPEGYTLARCMAGKGFALRDMGRYGEARSLLDASLLTDPTQEDVKMALGQLPQ